MATIARESCSTLSVGDFYAGYMLPNQPVLIDISAMTALWKVRTDWTKLQSDSSGGTNGGRCKKQRSTEEPRLDAARLREAAVYMQSAPVQEAVFRICPAVRLAVLHVPALGNHCCPAYRPRGPACSMNAAPSLLTGALGPAIHHRGSD